MSEERGRDTVKCLYCERYVDAGKTFSCRRCRKKPICLDHRDREYGVCSGCAAEARIVRYRDLLGQEKSLRSFLRLSQFVFMVGAFLFAAKRFFAEHLPAYIAENPFLQYPLIFGGTAVAGIVFCYACLSSQKGKLAQVEQEIHRHRAVQRG
jgi:hypothetical protein